MHEPLNNYPVYFPRRHEQLYTLKRFLDSSTATKYQLPIIVNVTSLNHYGRAVKNLLSKNTQLLLIGIYELDSILAEYHPGHDGRHLAHRHRLTHVQGKMATRATSRLRSMRKLSKSLASLTAVNQTNIVNQGDEGDDHDDDHDDDDRGDFDERFSHERNLLKTLNEKRSSTIPFCRIPMHYRRYFEVLNENDQAVEPFHNLTDLILPEYPRKSMEKWPKVFFLRSSCTAYTQKTPAENDLNSYSVASNDSCYSSSSDLDFQKNVILLNEDFQTLRPGQTLRILGECMASYIPVVEREIKEQQQQQQHTSPVSSPAPSSSSTSSWFRDKSRMLFAKRRRRSQASSDTSLTNEMLPNRSLSKTSEPYLKCQTQSGDIVFIHLHESGLFSPLNFQTSRSKSTSEFARYDISGVYQLKHLLPNFRFPFSVRHLDGSILFENGYSPAAINQKEQATKLRLLTNYTENVVFACPLNLVLSKSCKTALPLLLLPLPVNADIEIQPCSNMSEISKSEEFQKLIENCFHLIEQFRNEISLIHFPLQFTDIHQRRKQALRKQRSQSVTNVGHYDDDDDLKNAFRQSDENLHRSNDDSTDRSASSVSSPLRYRASIETVQQKQSIDAGGSANTRRASQSTQKSRDRQNRPSQDENVSEDEMYQDVDKIYDYIRSGDITPEVQKIQAREKFYHSSHAGNVQKTSPKQVCLFAERKKENMRVSFGFRQ